MTSPNLSASFDGAAASGASRRSNATTADASTADASPSEPPSCLASSRSRLEPDTDQDPESEPMTGSVFAFEAGSDQNHTANHLTAHKTTRVGDSARPKLEALDGGLLLRADSENNDEAAILDPQPEFAGAMWAEDAQEDMLLGASAQDNRAPNSTGSGRVRLDETATETFGEQSNQDTQSVGDTDETSDKPSAKLASKPAMPQDADPKVGESKAGDSKAGGASAARPSAKSVGAQLWAAALAGLKLLVELLARLPRPELRWRRAEMVTGASHGSDDSDLENGAGAAAIADAAEVLLLDNIRALRTARVEDVRVPRADMTFISHDMSLDDIVAKAKDAGHSRFPVMGESQDEILGMIHIKDLLWGDIDAESFRVQNFLREVLFVAPSMPVLQLLQDMQLKRHHMALIVDEFGGIDGLVTIEDLVEEIVGDISDEHDADREPALIAQADGTWIIDARYRIDELEELIGAFLTDDEREEDLDTLGGLVTHIAGRVPTRNELIQHETGMRFLVVEADPRRIKRLRLRAKSLAAAKGLASQANKQTR